MRERNKCTKCKELFLPDVPSWRVCNSCSNKTKEEVFTPLTKKECHELYLERTAELEPSTNHNDIAFNLVGEELNKNFYL